MTSSRLMAANVIIAAVAAVLMLYIARQFMAPMPLPLGGRRAATSGAAAPALEPPRPPVGVYNVVAARNLFSPTRTEGQSSTLVTGSAPVVKPNLFGVVVRDNGSIAYLEDPTTKRVAGYRVGDPILGGTVQAIRSDIVMIDAPGGAMEVRLHDPGKPRATPAAVSGAPQPAVAPAMPGVIPPAAPPAQVAQPPAVQPGQVPPTVMPGQPPAAVMPGQPPLATTPPAIPGRRALPPNLLRRVPPGMGDAPQQ